MIPEDEIERVAEAIRRAGMDHEGPGLFRAIAVAALAVIDQTRRLAGLREAAEAGRSARGDSIAHRTGICMAVEAIEARIKEIEHG